MPLLLRWQAFNLNTLALALPKCHCLYALWHPDDGARPFYIGKAKFFGPSQADGYKSSARYNGGYQHLLAGLLRSGFTLYIAEIGEANFENAEQYEQDLIAKWNPLQNRKRTGVRRPTDGRRPWNDA